MKQALSHELRNTVEALIDIVAKWHADPVT